MSIELFAQLLQMGALLGVFTWWLKRLDAAVQRSHDLINEIKLSQAATGTEVKGTAGRVEKLETETRARFVDHERRIVDTDERLSVHIATMARTGGRSSSR